MEQEMMGRTPLTMNVRGDLWSFSVPKVMGILNLTPDSFYAASRVQTEAEIARRAEQLVVEGADVIDVGACSTRPGADVPDADEESRRLRRGLVVVRRVVPQAVVSVDTFRAEVARMCVEEFGADMINDVSGGEADAAMFGMAARLHVPYVVTHIKGSPKTMQQSPQYEDVVCEVLEVLSRKVAALHALGVNDVVVDPGFGFGKTLDDNYRLMRHLRRFKLLGCPVLVGVSRKSMVQSLLEIGSEEALNGTTALHAVALMLGADILRVHDVRAAVEAVKVVGKVMTSV